ncbi:MAG: response regulator transcription factor [Thermomicrobiales bacterium]
MAPGRPGRRSGVRRRRNRKSGNHAIRCGRTRPWVASISGDEVCTAMVAMETTPRIIMLTAAGNVDSRIEGLSLGADDYLPKPFVMAELIARVRALARRPNAATPPQLVSGDLVIDTTRHAATRSGRPLSLTRKEFGVLETIVAAQGRVVSSEDLLERVWDEAADPFTNAVRITVMTLRRKLGEPPLIETVIGVGYKLAGE